jgi:hypothetical protein
MIPAPLARHGIARGGAGAGSQADCRPAIEALATEMGIWRRPLPPPPSPDRQQARSGRVPCTDRFISLGPCSHSACHLNN